MATKNFAKATVSTGYNATALVIAVSAGHGAKFTGITLPFLAVWWNFTDYADPSDDPGVEVISVTGITGDILTIARAQESTSASVKNVAAKTYKLHAGLTAGMWDGVSGSAVVADNPSAPVGLTAVNGSAVTYMRSDAAPALSQAIAPAWTAQHAFGNGIFIGPNSAADHGGALNDGMILYSHSDVGAGDLSPQEIYTDIYDGSDASWFNLVLYPTGGNGARLGVGNITGATERAVELHATPTRSMVRFNGGNGNWFITPGTGSPETVVTADEGSIYLRTDGGAGTTLYVKESGGGNTGWRAVVSIDLTAVYTWLADHKWTKSSPSTILEIENTNAGGFSELLLDANGTTGFLRRELTALYLSGTAGGKIAIKDSGATELWDATGQRYIHYKKTLTDAATGMFRVALPTLKMCGGVVDWTIIASDGTDVQALTGTTKYSAINKGGVYTSTINTVDDAPGVCSSGTLSAVFAITTGVNIITLQVTPAGSLTETVYEIYYTLRNNSPQAITLL